MNQKSSEKEAFDSFYAANASIALSIARRRLPANIAEEIVAEAFVLAWTKKTFELEHQRARAWLLTTVYNLYRNVARKTAREVSAEPETVQLLEQDVSTRGSATFSGQATSNSPTEFENERYDRAWSALSESDREILQLAYHDDLSSSDIEAITGATARAVRTRLSRARSRFRDHYEKLSPTQSLTRLEMP